MIRRVSPTYYKSDTTEHPLDSCCEWASKHLIQTQKTADGIEEEVVVPLMLFVRMEQVKKDDGGFFKRRRFWASTFENFEAFFTSKSDSKRHIDEVVIVGPCKLYLDFEIDFEKEKQMRDVYSVLGKDISREEIVKHAEASAAATIAKIVSYHRIEQNCHVDPFVMRACKATKWSMRVIFNGAAGKPVLWRTAEHCKYYLIALSRAESLRDPLLAIYMDIGVYSARHCMRTWRSTKVDEPERPMLLENEKSTDTITTERLHQALITCFNVTLSSTPASTNDEPKSDSEDDSDDDDDESSSTNDEDDEFDDDEEHQKKKKKREPEKKKKVVEQPPPVVPRKPTKRVASTPIAIESDVVAKETQTFAMSSLFLEKNIAMAEVWGIKIISCRGLTSNQIISAAKLSITFTGQSRSDDAVLATNSMRARSKSVVVSTRSDRDDKDASNSSDNSTNNTNFTNAIRRSLLAYFDAFGPRSSWQIDPGTGFITIPCNSRQCSIRGAEHKSNHIYLLVDVFRNAWCERCSDADCQKAVAGRRIVWNVFPEDIALECKTGFNIWPMRRTVPSLAFFCGQSPTDAAAASSE